MSQSTPDRPPPTAEQIGALEVSDASVALSAGAGTGKTFVLAERFVRALEGPEASSLGRIIALTFTKKAARELRERIRKECRARLRCADDPRHWRAVLRGLEAARISTFHAFCGEILRRHAIEARIDPGFAVLDESIALSVRQRSLDQTLREALIANDPDLIDLAVEYGLGMVRDSIDSLMVNRSTGDLGDWADRKPRELVDRWFEIWERETKPDLLNRFRESLQPCLELIETNEFNQQKVRTRLDDLRATIAELNQPGEPGPRLDAIHELCKVVGLAAKLWPSTEVYEAFKTQFGSIREAIKKLKPTLDWDERATLEAAAQGLKFARLTVKARATYDQAKRDRGAIDNDDLLLIARELLARPGSSARAELEESLDLILVDEFQDTDPIQAEILELLAGSELLTGKLFLVGDVKQSIYRFRGARPDLFQNYRLRFHSNGRRELSANFRSIPAILAFVNTLFATTFIEDNAALRPGLEASVRADPAPPAITFLWESEPVEPKPTDKSESIDRRKQEAERIARHLRTRLDQGWMIVDPRDRQPRLAHQGDIAFLFRSLGNASDYEQALVAQGLDYHVVGGSGFYAQQEVLDLINVLTVIEDPLDPVALAGALRSPFFSISDDGLFWLATEHNGQIHKGLEGNFREWLEQLPEHDFHRANRARRMLADWRGVKDRLSIGGLVDRILNESGYEAALIGEFLGDRKRANARKLVQMARRFDEQGGFTLADFVARLRGDLRSVTRETQAATTDEAGEVIRLMTMHQAKGLEFPIVVIPDLGRKPHQDRQRVAFDPELGPLVNPVVDAAPEDDGEGTESGIVLGWSIHRQRERIAEDAEALRLFYVAVTRARDSLVLSAASNIASRPGSPALSLLSERFDLKTGRFRGNLPDGWPEPIVEVIEPERSSTTVPASPSRPQPRFLEVAQAIKSGLSQPIRPVPTLRPRPRTFTLDPAFGLSSTSARLDRLIRTILADPGSLDPAAIKSIAVRAARLQDPVSPRGLIDEAIDRVTTWARSPLAREIARLELIRRSFDWVLAWPEGPAATLFHGRGDLLVRTPQGGDVLIGWSDPAASEGRERLRLLLTTVAVEQMGLGQVQRAWWVRLGSKAAPVLVEDFGREAIDRAMSEVLDPSNPDQAFSGP